VRRFTPGGALIEPERTREAKGMLGLEHRFGLEWRVSAAGLAHAGTCRFKPYQYLGRV
jgi:hypothetical protein